MQILEMSISGSILILIVIVLRSLALHKLPKKIFITLWGMAIIRLLISPGIFSSLVGINALNRAASNSGAIGTTLPPPTIVLPSLKFPVLAKTSATTVPNSIFLIFTKVWFLGFSIMVLYFAFTYIYINRKFREADLVRDNKVITKLLEDAKIKRTVVVKSSSRVSSAYVLGLIRPKILLSSAMVSGDTELLSYAFVHELQHLRSFDMLWKLILLCTMCVHWFNPLVWILFLLLSRDLELACDEGVIRRLGENAKTAYALSLIKMAERNCGIEQIHFGFSKTAIEERIFSIMKHNKISVFSIVVSALLILGMTSAFAFTSATFTTKGDDFPESIVVRRIQYEPFGLVLNEEKGEYYYEGKPVRYFEDFYTNSDGVKVGSNYINSIGEVDLYTVCDVDGKIINITLFSQEEYNERSAEFNNPFSPFREQTAFPNSLTVMNWDTRNAVFEPYVEYGLIYDQRSDSLYYNGELVRYFEDDIMTYDQTTNEASGTLITHYPYPKDNGGIIDVYAIRSKDKKELLELVIADQDTFDEMTEILDVKMK